MQHCRRALEHLTHRLETKVGKTAAALDQKSKLGESLLFLLVAFYAFPLFSFFHCNVQEVSDTFSPFLGRQSRRTQSISQPDLLGLELVILPLLVVRLLLLGWSSFGKRLILKVSVPESEVCGSVEEGIGFEVGLDECDGEVVIVDVELIETEHFCRQICCPVSVKRNGADVAAL